MLQAMAMWQKGGKKKKKLPSKQLHTQTSSPPLSLSVFLPMISASTLPFLQCDSFLVWLEGGSNTTANYRPVAPFAHQQLLFSHRSIISLIHPSFLHSHHPPFTPPFLHPPSTPPPHTHVSKWSTRPPNQQKPPKPTNAPRLVVPPTATSPSRRTTSLKNPSLAAPKSLSKRTTPGPSATLVTLSPLSLVLLFGDIKLPFLIVVRVSLLCQDMDKNSKTRPGPSLSNPHALSHPCFSKNEKKKETNN